MADAVAAECAEVAPVPKAAVDALRHQQEIAAAVDARAIAIRQRCMELDPLRRRLPRARVESKGRAERLLSKTVHTLAAEDGARFLSW